MSTRLVVMLLAVSAAAYCGEWEFDQVVKAIESHYGVKRTKIPFMGVANFALKLKRPAGASEFHLAVFEELGSSPAYRDGADRDRLMNTLLGHGLQPLVAARSRHGGVSTYIYMTEAHKSAKILIANFESDGATIIQVKADAKTLWRAIEDPANLGESLRADPDE